METYNAHEHLDEPTMFNHLMLDGEVDALCKDSKFDPENLQVELKINGHDVSIKDFNEVLKDWAERIRKDVERHLDYLEKDEAVTHRAERLVNDKLNNLHNILSDVENSLWKLEL